MLQIEKHSLHTIGKSRAIFVSPVILNEKKINVIISTGYFWEKSSDYVRLGSFLRTVANRFRKSERIYAGRRLFDGVYVMDGFKY